MSDMPLWRRALAAREGGARPPVAPSPTPPAVWRLIDQIAHEHGLSGSDIISHCRVSHVVRARHHAMAVVRWSTGLSLPALGRAFARDHSTVLAGVRAWEARLNP